MNERDLLQAGFRYALSLRPAPGEADDLVQEAWLRLHRARGRVRDQALLFRAIRNLFIDHYRRERLVVFEPLDSVAETADGAPLLDDRVTLDDLKAPLESLRSEEREALFLNVVEGYTAQEIADLTERPRGTVLSLIHRAKRKLREALTSESDDTPLIEPGMLRR